MTASINIKFEINRESGISPLSAGLDVVAALTEQGHIVTEALIDFDNPVMAGPVDIKNIVRRE